MKKGDVYRSTYLFRSLGLLLISGRATWRIVGFTLKNNRDVVEPFGGWQSVPGYIWPLNNPISQSVEARSLKQMAENGLCYQTDWLGLAAEENQDHPALSHGLQDEFWAPKPGHRSIIFLVSNLSFTITFGFSWQTITLSNNKSIKSQLSSSLDFEI